MLYRVHEMKRMEDKLVERSATLDYTPSKGMSGSAETSLEMYFLAVITAIIQGVGWRLPIHAIHPTPSVNKGYLLLVPRLLLSVILACINLLIFNQAIRF